MFLLKVALSVFIICVFSSVSVAADLKVVHTDQAWTGKDVPSFQGDKDKLPENFEAISSHECGQCGGGVYLGPCSGGKGHTYYGLYLYQECEWR